MSCSELGKEYMCQEAHFKLPYENIPENEQDGITKKSGGKKTLIQHWINWGKKQRKKTPVDPECVHIYTGQKH